MESAFNKEELVDCSVFVTGLKYLPLFPPSVGQFIHPKHVSRGGPGLAAFLELLISGFPAFQYGDINPEMLEAISTSASNAEWSR